MMRVVPTSNGEHCSRAMASSTGLVVRLAVHQWEEGGGRVCRKGKVKWGNEVPDT